jgi:nucleotide-binding universal stress UspA family protein
MSAMSYGRSVVVGYEDVSSRAALDWAAAEAARHGTTLRVVTAYTPDSSYPWGYTYLVPPSDIQRVAGIVKENALSRVEDAAQRARAAHPGLEVLTTVANASPAAALVTASQQASLVVVGAHPHRHAFGSLGSVSLALAAHTACPVVVVPWPEPKVAREGTAAAAADLRDDQDRPAAAIGQVVVGVDESPECEDAIGFAFEQASSRGIELTALHAWWMDPSVLSAEVAESWQGAIEEDRMVVDEALAGWRSRYPDVKVHRVVGRAPAVNALRAASAGAELLVVGSRGRGGFASLLLGSVSRSMLQRATCAVAVVRRGQFDRLANPH